MVRRRLSIFSAIHRHIQCAWSCYLFLGQTFYSNFCFLFFGSVASALNPTNDSRFCFGVETLRYVRSVEQTHFKCFPFWRTLTGDDVRGTMTTPMSFSTTQAKTRTAQEKAVHFNSLLRISFSIFFFCCGRCAHFFLNLLRRLLLRFFFVLVFGFAECRTKEL